MKKSKEKRLEDKELEKAKLDAETFVEFYKAGFFDRHFLKERIKGLKKLKNECLRCFQKRFIKNDKK